VEALADGRSEEQIMSAVEEYLEIDGFLDGGLQQVLETLESLSPQARQKVESVSPAFC
jgi:hypothetical protein